jgi:hypothetical protein
VPTVAEKPPISKHVVPQVPPATPQPRTVLAPSSTCRSLADRHHQRGRREVPIEGHVELGHLGGRRGDRFEADRRHHTLRHVDVEGAGGVGRRVDGQLDRPRRRSQEGVADAAVDDVIVDAQIQAIDPVNRQERRGAREGVLQAIGVDLGAVTAGQQAGGHEAGWVSTQLTVAHGQAGTSGPSASIRGGASRLAIGTADVHPATTTARISSLSE